MIETRLDSARAEKELDEYKTWLNQNAEFPENRVVTKLKARKDLCLLIQLAAGKGQPDRYKYEFMLQGAFRADLVVGSSKSKHFVLVEFEGGSPNSIFNRKKGSAQLKDWGGELQHAFSQVSDWSWAKNDNQHSVLYKNAFGSDPISETYQIVCGQRSFLGPTDSFRLCGRSEKMTIELCPIRSIRPGQPNRCVAPWAQPTIDGTHYLCPASNRRLRPWRNTAHRGEQNGRLLGPKRFNLIGNRSIRVPDSILDV
ncbi:DUF4263 domain-containing protein [Skermanella sp. TT6]|uniref:DUF4263 domain-containing protein n=1 Tax=Skermanella cutis TaxID=2775420 RepID=A0ABX7B7P6_9PROT|nr:Shedu anti-phage system protein SduA domain-containing protein [Skermanella sp. TT6]QQP90158.1 DUF4263 domain-containing protein [Skermanella sp. TT6]